LSWDPVQYARFASPRLRPALDLLQRVPSIEARGIVDLGCGTGEVTRLLARRWPQAEMWGVDASAPMLTQAEAQSVGGSTPAREHGGRGAAGDGDALAPPSAQPTGVNIHWQQAALETWRAPRPLDLIFSNAALHWVPDHEHLFPPLLKQLAPGGVLALQMPRNFDQPSHTLIAATAREPRWRERLAPLIRDTPVGAPQFYDALLSPHAAALDIWQTRYLHVLDGPDPVKEWTKGTWLRPFLDALEEPDRSAFEARYAERLREAYPARPDGKTCFEFNRLFVVMRKR